MAKFKIGDRVKCIDFEGGTGFLLRELGDVPLIVTDVYRYNNEDFICVNGRSRHPYGATPKRFVLEDDIVPHDPAAEYEETMEFERLVNG